MLSVYKSHGRSLRSAASGLALLAGGMWALPAVAAEVSAASAPDARQGERVEDIVVTAQKREERLQDVPISVTAISEGQLTTHRFEQLQDLNGLAPNLVLSAGIVGQNTITATMRGLLSAPATPGQSPGVAFYLDGIFLGSNYGNLLSIADIERVEVLKGPQGTLFGRSSVGGAISIITSKPTGEFHVKNTVSVGNYDQFKERLHVDLPRMGMFTANFTYQHFERRGDIKNLGAGTYWDLTAARDSLPVRGTHKNDIFRSADTLGDQNVDAFAATVRFEPSSNLDLTYKFDYQHNDYTSPGIGISNQAFIPAFPLLSLLYAAQPPGFVAPTGPQLTRPDAINNDFSGVNTQKNYGHALTFNWNVNDTWTVKNVASYRHSELVNNVPFNGTGGLTITPLLITFMGFANPAIAAAYPAGSPAYGTPFLNGVDTNFHVNEYSNEFQVFMRTHVVDVTAGALYYKLDSIDLNTKAITYPNANGTYLTGAGTAADPYKLSTCGAGIPGTPANATLYGCEPNDGAGQQELTNSTKAVYGQAQFHVASGLDLVAGGRVSWDKATYVGDINNPFKKSTARTSTYLLGINYKPTDDMLLYAKWSTGFIPGGIFSGRPYGAEHAKSYEAGIKADWFDHKLRTNIALFDVTYDALQGFAQDPVTGSFIVTNLVGKAKARGFEFEGTVVPTDGLTLGVNVGYTDLKFDDPMNVQAYAPDWTVGLNGQYKSAPISGLADGRFLFNVDANFTSPLYPFGCLSVVCGILTPDVLKQTRVGSQWLVNGRMGLTEIGIGQVSGKDAGLEIAFWVRNLFDNKSLNSAQPDFTTFSQAAGWQPARTFGVDFTAKF